MMRVLLILLSYFALSRAQSYDDEPAELIFKSCILPKWTCVNETNDLSSYVSKVSYACQQSTYTTETRYEYDSYYGGNRDKTYSVVVPGENITLDLSNWTKWTLTALTVKNCNSVVLRMHTNFDSNIDKFILSDVTTLFVQPPKSIEYQHHPCNVYFKNVKLIPELPTGAISDNSTKQVIFQNVAIDSLSQGAIGLHGAVKAFTLRNVTVDTMEGQSVSVSMDPNSKFHISSSNFSTLLSNSISVENGLVIIRNSNFSQIQEASLVIKAESISLINNFFDNFGNALFVEASRIEIKGNEFSDKIQAVKNVNWNGHKYRGDYQQTAFFFVQNFIRAVKKEESSCTSKSSAFVNTGNCTRRYSVSEYFASKDRPKKAMLFYLLVCGNNFNFEIPSEWFPKTETEFCSGL